MPVTEMKAKELRLTDPTKSQLIEAVEYLGSLGWRFKAADDPNHPAYTWGWWINQAHETKCRPTGDPRDFYFAAWQTLATYVAAE